MPRGRPRQYDPDAALDAVMRVFWSKGFHGTALDDLVVVTGMNRPSLYNAFGNKEAIYQLALQRFVERMNEQATRRLEQQDDIAEALLDFYLAALDIYFEGAEPQGCLVFCTATPDALGHPKIRADLYAVIQQVDAIFERRFRRAEADGQIVPGKVRALAAMAQALLHSLALRARAGETKRTLRRIARESVLHLLGGAGRAQPAPSNRAR